MPRLLTSTSNTGTVLLAVLSLLLCVGAAWPVSAQESEANRPQEIVDVLAQLDAIAEKANRRATELHTRSRQAVDLRRALPADFSNVAGASAADQSLDRDIREDELTLLLAQFREYRRTVISLYDIVGSDNEPENSVHGLMVAWLEKASELSKNWHALPEDRRSAVDPATANAIQMLQSFAAALPSRYARESGQVLALSNDSLLLPTSSMSDPPSLVELPAEEGFRAPGLLLLPLEEIARDTSQIRVVLDGNFLRDLQSIIDPVERAQFAIEHEYQALEAARLQSLDETVQTADAAGDAASTSQSDLARLNRQIERRTGYRDQLLRSAQTAILRFARQKRATGSGEFLPDVRELVEGEVKSGLTAESKEELLRIANAISADLGEFNARPSSVLEERLDTEVKQAGEALEELRKALAALTAERAPGVPNLERTATRLKIATLEASQAAKSLRLSNLRESMSRELAMLQVAESRLGVAIQNVAAIDHRISQLSSQRSDSATTFYIWAAAKVLVILFLAWLLIAIVKVLSGRIVKRVKGRVQMEEGDVPPERQREVTARADTLQSVAVTTVKVVVWVTAALMILGQFEVNYHPLLLATGGVTLAIGFGAQSLVKDFFSGFFILLENQFQVGDVITVNGTSGGVESVSLRTTRLRSVDGTLHVIPNGNITMVSNMTHLWSRMSINIGVGYSEDPDEIREVLNRIGDELYADPEWQSLMFEAPRVTGLDNFGGSSVDFRVMCKVQPGEQWAVTREYRRRVKIGFDVAGIEIPYAYVNYVPVTPGESKVLTNRNRNREISMPREDRIPDGGR